MSDGGYENGDVIDEPLVNDFVVGVAYQAPGAGPEVDPTQPATKPAASKTAAKPPPEAAPEPAPAPESESK